MLETKQGDEYKKAFHNKYPKAISYKSNEPTTVVGSMHDQVRWGKENLVADALITCYPVPDGVMHYKLEWFLTDDVDVMAVKLRYE